MYNRRGGGERGREREGRLEKGDKFRKAKETQENGCLEKGRGG